MSPSVTGTVRRGAGLPLLGRLWHSLRASPSLVFSSPLRRVCPFPRNSRHEREAVGGVSPSVAAAVAVVAAPAGGGPRPASGRRFLLARPGTGQLLRRR